MYINVYQRVLSLKEENVNHEKPETHLDVFWGVMCIESNLKETGNGA